jgi:putative endonuclease
MNLRLLLGKRGERVAARYLKRECGHRILVTNYRCCLGEIDLITLDKDTVVFVETKTRVSDDLAAPFEAVGSQKQHQMVKVAKYFLMERGRQNAAARFDVISIVWPKRGRPVIEHFQDAFQAPMS